MEGENAEICVFSRYFQLLKLQHARLYGPNKNRTRTQKLSGTSASLLIDSRARTRASRTLDDPNSYAIIYQLPFNGFSRIEPDNIYSANEGVYSQLIATKGVDWFASYVYSLRNALFHEIITPLDEEWQIIFKSAYLVLKQVSDICIATINRIIEFPQSKENAVFDYAATHQDSVFSALADSVELLDYPEMTLSNWKIDHGKIILKGWFLAKLKLQNGTAEEIGTGAGAIEEIGKGFDFEIMLDDDFSIVRDSENNDCILIQLQKS